MSDWWTTVPGDGGWPAIVGGWILLVIGAVGLTIAGVMVVKSVQGVRKADEFALKVLPWMILCMLPVAFIAGVVWVVDIRL